MTARAHLVYAVPQPPTRSRVQRGLRRSRSVLNDLGLPVGLLSSREPTPDDLAAWPSRAPYTNTRYLYDALSRRLPTRLYHLTERVRCSLGEEDVFLGHPYFPHRAGACGVTELAAMASRRPRRFGLITPLHCDTRIRTRHLDAAFLHDVDRLVPRADVLFGIMGPYWWDRWSACEFSHWKPKMIRLDMAVNATAFPRVKGSFNPPGDRRFFMIGASDEPLKGSDLLRQIASMRPNVEFGWIGDGPEIPGVRHISPSRPLTSEFMRTLGERYDVFLSCSRADANPTTILESMAWGFPVISTMESGYYATGYRRTAHFAEVGAFAAAIDELQSAPEEELLAMSGAAREVVARDYTWGRFTDTVLGGLGL